MENPSLDPLFKRIKVRALRFYSADEAPAGRHAFRPPFTVPSIQYDDDGNWADSHVNVKARLRPC